MRETTIARNYAETLLELARRNNDLRGFGSAIGALATAMGENRDLRLFLESPRVAAEKKIEILNKAFAGKLPPMVVKFVAALVKHRRQMLVPEISKEYMDLVDQAEGRMHAEVTVARVADDAEKAAIAAQLSKVFGKEVVPHLTVDPSIMGGVVVRVGETVLDGSVRRRLSTLRARMLAGR